MVEPVRGSPQRPRLPRRKARTGLVREVPPRRRAPGAAQARAGLDRARPPGRGLSDQAAGRGLALRDACRRPTRDAAGCVRTGATFDDAVAEWLRYVEHDRDCKPSTLSHYRSTVNAHLLPAFSGLRVEDITTRQIEAWRSTLGRERAKPISNRTRNNAVGVLHGVLERARRVFGLPHNPAADIEPLRERYDATRFAFYSPEEVLALARAPRANRTRRSSLRPPTPVCVAAASSHCAGATWTSRATRSASVAATPTGS